MAEFIESIVTMFYGSCKIIILFGLTKMSGQPAIFVGKCQYLQLGIISSTEFTMIVRKGFLTQNIWKCLFYAHPSMINSIYKYVRNIG